MKKHLVSGKINVGCLFLTVLLIAGGYVGFKFGRVHLAKYLFNQKLFEISGDVAKDYSARIFPNNRAITEAIIESAEKLTVDITNDDIRIKRDGQSVTINVTWEGELIFPKYTHYFFFEFEAKREVVY